MSADWIARLVGMVLFAILGVYSGFNLGQLLGQEPGAMFMSPTQLAIGLGALGAVIGLILSPFISVRPVLAIRHSIGRMSAKSFVALLIGLVVGLLIAALLAFPLSLLPTPFGQIMPLIGVILFGYLGMVLFSQRQEDLLAFFTSLRRGTAKAGTANPDTRQVLLDTSVIIDGRIADIARTGFIPGTLVIPRFVLNELQHIADSADALRRQRGRRGMDVVAALQRESALPVRISDQDAESVSEVDDKLIVLARQLGCPILTNDYNLNRVAALQGTQVLNINELANAVKSTLLPGEMLNIEVIQEGKEYGQGVGYLEDGTMVVIDGGREQIGRTINVVVTKMLQTAAGRMVFARPDRDLSREGK